LGGLASYAGGELFGSAGGGASADTIDALGSSGNTGYLGSSIGDLYGGASTGISGDLSGALAGGSGGGVGSSLASAGDLFGASPVQVSAGSLGSAGGSTAGGGGISDVLGSFNASGAGGITSGAPGTGATGALGGSTASDASSNWWQSVGGGGQAATPTGAAAGAPAGGVGGQPWGQLAGTSGGTGAATTAGGTGSTLGNIAGGLGKWAMRNPATALQLGMAAFGATQKPQLPSALKSLTATEQGNISAAEGIINSGGTSSSSWASQKSAIDANINQQIQQTKEALLQRAANSGLDPNSMVVQQQIAQLTSQAETQRQTLYQQAQSQNVQEAMSLLSGGSQTLTQIGQVQMAEDQQAQQLIAQLAGGALNTYAKQGQNAAQVGA
jgi:hypothetical protein